MPEATTTKELATTPTHDQTALTHNYGIDVGRVVAMRAAVQEVMVKVLREGEHYGEIPGTTQEGKKPKKVLLQPGAEVLCQVFRLRPEYEEMSVVEKDDFIFIKLRCRLYSNSGELIGESIASANTREEKYATQTSSRLCPECGKATIFRSKKKANEPDKGWFCWAAKGGCGAQFAVDEKRLVDQVGAPNMQKVWSLYHIIESIAQKRGYVKATRTATACSDIFTDEQDEPGDDDPQGQQPTQAASRPTAGQKVTAVQIQNLNAELDKRGIGYDEAQDLVGRERDDSLRASRLRWCNGFLQKPVNSLMELSGEQASKLIDAAKNGKEPFNKDAGSDG